MAEGVFAAHLSDYPGLELLWLQAMFEQRSSTAAQAAPLLPSSGGGQAAGGLVGLLPAAIQSRFAQARAGRGWCFAWAGRPPRLPRAGRLRQR